MDNSVLEFFWDQDSTSRFLVKFILLFERTSKGNFKRIVRSPTMGDRSTDDIIYKVIVEIPLFFST